MNLGEEKEQELILDFMSITNADIDTARFSLEAANWNLQTATSLFFDNPNENNFQEERKYREPIPDKVVKLTEGKNNF
jgi:hypothetical protein